MTLIKFSTFLFKQDGNMRHGTVGKTGQDLSIVRVFSHSSSTHIPIMQPRIILRPKMIFHHQIVQS